MKSNELFGLLQSDVALKAAQEAGVSGWVYETKQPPDFKTAQNRFLSHECPLG
jgi:hypothetical protein